MTDIDKRVEEFSASLEIIREDEPEALPRVIPELCRLLDAKKALAFGVCTDGGKPALAFAHAAGDLSVAGHALQFNELLSSGKAPLLFNPAKPEQNQRNVALVLPPLSQIPSTGVLVKKARRGRPIRLWPRAGFGSLTDFVQNRQLLRDAGIHDDFVLRALICDGSTLLAWVGIFQPQPPTDRQREILASLVPVLHKRLKAERLIGKSPLNAAALDLVLDKLTAPAFLIDAGAAIVRANSAGRCVARTDWTRLEHSLRDSLLSPGPQAPYELTRLRWSGVSDHYLAIERSAARERAHRVDRAVKQWSLRTQGARVLSRLVEGDANKVIATKLGCAESTIELHVTQILRQAGVDSRAALIAKFWSRL